VRRSGLVALLSIAACRGPSRAEAPRTSSAPYADPAMWACRPDRADDLCHGELSATELLPDGSQRAVPFVRPADPQVDCFYIYPTVDLARRVGNHAELKLDDHIARAVRAQIARFSSVCNVYAPLYRQVTIGTYVFGGDRAKTQRFFDVAYSDVAAAFHEYLTHFDRGHKIVILGHSQGAQMAARLLHDTFDQDAALRARLLVGMPIGYDANVPDGATVGGTFEHLAPCTTDDETGCLVAYRSIAIGDNPDKRAFELPPGRRAICVNPAGAGERDTPLTSSVPAHELHAIDVPTPYVIERDAFRARCVADPAGHDYLEIRDSNLPGDRRPKLLELASAHGALGLHIYDFQLPQEDLIALIARKLAAAAR
jgi:pimeloyl-ACP methyl ester carboxylesterase